MKTRRNNLESGFTLIETIIALVVVGIVAAMMAAYFGTSITQSSTPIFRLTEAGKLNQIMEKITADYNNEPATWSPGTAYAPTNSILGTLLPTIILPTAANRNGNQYICTTGGTSGTTEPNWSSAAASGATVSDGTVTWTYGGSTPPTNWVANTIYPSLNAVVYPTNGYQYVCTVAGISGSATPAWPTTVNATVTDNTVTWKCSGSQPTVALQTKIGAEVTGGQDYTKTFGGISISYRVIQNRFIKFVSNTEVSPIAAGDSDYGKYLKVTISLPMSDSNRTGETLTTLFVRR
jgi:prepilin-type N-terminal cleavage/methylation domain-containing protein